MSAMNMVQIQGSRSPAKGMSGGPAVCDQVIGRETGPEGQCDVPETRSAPRDASAATYGERALRAFCCRLFGCGDEGAGLVNEVMHVLLDAAERGGAIGLRGASDLVPVARALHHRIFGAERPFVVC